MIKFQELIHDNIMKDEAKFEDSSSHTGRVKGKNFLITKPQPLMPS